MLQRAREMGPADALTVQSIALEFDDREQARSRVLLRYGPVRRAADFTADEARFVASFNEAIRRDLSAELVEAATWDDHRLLSCVAEMLANDAGDPSMAGWSRFGRQARGAFEAARRGLRAGEDAPAGPERNAGEITDDPRGASGGPASLVDGSPEIAAVRDAVKAYHERLLALGLADEDIACPPAPSGARNVGTGSPRGGRASLPRRLALSLALPLAVIGILLQAPPYLATKLLAGRVKSGDETSTIRMGLALALHPPWTALLLGLLFWRCPLPWSLLLAAVALISPVATIAWIDAIPLLLRAARRRLHGSALPALREARRAAMASLRETGGF
jgi:hypothetical protein